ncbi:MAG: DUF4038 domain-containing protein [Eubacteriales bacterium]|nr:DUF4038 domain-containing protein [Eubacteriales bacterium]
MKQYEMFELTYQAAEPEGSHVHVDLQAVFTHNGKETQVKGFYAGDGNYKIRFYPSEAGNYHVRVNGIVQDEQDITCEPASNAKGMVRACGTHFKYDNGEWYYPFGTTVYGLIHQTQELMEQTFETLEKAPFNKIRFCIFPKHYDYNHNDPEVYAFEGSTDNWDMNHPCFTYWDRLEARIAQMDRMGMQCDIILFHSYDRWGFAKLSMKQTRDYLEYLTRRLAAYPNVWWSLANEYDIMQYTMQQWEEIEEYVSEHDPFDHLLSNHQMVHPWDFSRENVTHICTQIKDVDNIKHDIQKYRKPMLVDECRYEGNIPYEWGNLSGFEMVNRFWKVVCQGGYCTHGETFLDPADILWWAKGGTLHGQSPERILFLRELTESFPGPLTFAGRTMTEEDVRKSLEHPGDELKNSTMYQVMLHCTPKEVVDFVEKFQGFYASCEDEVFLRYYETQCTAVGLMELPTEHTYDIEVIDVWNMTRTKVLSGVNGAVKVELPGREGMALLATKNN